MAGVVRAVIWTQITEPCHFFQRVVISTRTDRFSFVYGQTRALKILAFVRFYVSVPRCNVHADDFLSWDCVFVYVIYRHACCDQWVRDQSESLLSVLCVARHFKCAHFGRAFKNLNVSEVFRARFSRCCCVHKLAHDVVMKVCLWVAPRHIIIFVMRFHHLYSWGGRSDALHGGQQVKFLCEVSEPWCFRTKLPFVQKCLSQDHVVGQGLT